ncbi:5-oxoprolinase subunit PxpB [Photobacterium sanguinicancri]|uniref:5-oxoprolinase subunit PxpB n=1 Tax=Photobacterium sanguinicancri TaxID=875932 RepID=A0AAW7Y6T2_9GAMM|nr:5-oxoprolinase subunit PxpB [Photobacterium sanguinicancri]MDO6542998.1 5-oxoprolinase subunit PxpB [Photobacterium sanguinicancri]
MMRIERISETTLMVYFANKIDVELAAKIACYVQRIKEVLSPAVVEITPSYCSLLLQLSPEHCAEPEIGRLIAQLEKIYQDCDFTSDSKKLSKTVVFQGKQIVLPVYYDVSVGPDLVTVAEHAQVTIDEVIRSHSQQRYTVCAIGFAPGFAFLASVDARIATPRLVTPRHFVPAGSVGIANEQTAIYPANSPGGWQIIGNCPQSLFDPNTDPMSPFDIGDQVQFEPIDRQTYIALGGQLWQQ